MRHHRSAALLATPLLAALAACSSGSTPHAAPTSSGEPCSGLANATAIPDACAPSVGPSADPSSTIKATTDLPPVTLAPDKGQLAAGGNDKDPSLASSTFSVTVPVGTALKIHAACLGANHIVITTQPRTKAESEFNCGFHGVASEVGVTDDTVAKAPTQYVVTVKTTAPARWYVNVIGTTDLAASPI